jgi:iron complex outermembrane receptor protein
MLGGFGRRFRVAAEEFHCGRETIGNARPRFMTLLMPSAVGLRRGVAAFLSSVCLAAAAQAPAADSATQTLAPVIVTGTYLPEAATLGASPVVTFDGPLLARTGATDLLRALKSLSPSFSGSANVGNEVNLQGTGESNAALRNLPTLVLLNGRRLANSPFSSNSSTSASPAVDLNTIPLGMVERVEVLKDSASTLYGSDAVGGVINVILRRSFSGGEAGGRYGTDGKGDYSTREGWVTAGVNRSGGSLVVGAQYFESTPLLSTDRKVSLLAPADLVALGQNPAVLAAHISSSYAGRNGNFIIAGSPLAAGAAGYNAAIRSLPAKTDPNAAPRSIESLVAAGYYLPIASTPLSREAGGSATILNTALYGFATVLPTERRQFVASGEKQLAGRRLEVFGDYLYSRTLNGGSNLAPSPLAQVAPLRIPANNPYNLFGVPIGAGGAPNAPGVRTRLDEFGSRSSDNLVETHRAVAGLRGGSDAAWRWEAAYHYSRAKGRQTFFGGASGVALQQALIPLLDAGGAAYVYDSQRRPLSTLSFNGRNVPVFDFFGVAGANAPETLEALRTTLHRSADLTQRGADGRVTGKLVELPAGTLTAALGGEWRSEATSSAADSLFNSGLAVGYIPLGNLLRGERRTRAVFLETHVPLAGARRTAVWARELDATLAIRHERIQPGGNATTPKVGLRWRPWDPQLVLRATYAEGFVAPSVFALYGPAQGAVPAVTLPEGNGRTGSGGATGRIVGGQFIAQVIERSNPNLLAAKSESRTLGIAYSPAQVKGLNFSADYYRVQRDKVGGFDYTFIVADLNARGSASPYAAGFRFVDGTTLTSTAANQVTSTNAGTLGVVYDPVGDVWTDGLDISAVYQWAAGGMGRFEAGADANVLFNYKGRANPTSAYLQYARVFTESVNGKGNPQGLQPGYSGHLHLAHVRGGWRTTGRFHYVPATTAPGTRFGEAAGTPNILRADRQSYRIASYRTFDLTVSHRWPESTGRWLRGTTVTVGANNLFDAEPPFVPGAGSGIGTESNTVKQAYDIVGRFLFVEVRREF